MTATTAQKTWAIDASHSSVEFAVKHMVFTTAKGRFGTFSGTIVADETNPANSSVKVIIDVESIDTRDEKRDGHLKSPDFFDAAGHPTMTFVSKSVSDVKGTEFKLAGDLTIRGTTKPVVLDVELVGPIAGPGGKQRVGFTGTTRINRMDYGLKWNNLTEAGGVVVSENVDIILEIEAIQEAPAN